MAKLRIGLVVLATLLLGGCETVRYSMEFEQRPVAEYHAVGKFFRVFIHPRQDTLLIEGGWGQALSTGLVSGATLGLVTGNSAYQQWSAGAHWLVDPVGCEVRELHPVDQATTWAFDFHCPPGVDLRRLLVEHHDGLMHDQPLPAIH